MAVPSSVRLASASYQIPQEVAVSVPVEAWPRGIAVRFTKRAIDVLIAGLGLFFGAPLFGLIALAVRLDSKGPIFYRQWRASMLEARRANGHLHFSRFQMIKFRSMRVDAEKLTGAVLAEENDPRITRVGRFLRKTRLDELPQLWNVLIGDMSVVGPRPERPELLENLAYAIPFFEERLRGTKPGITGLAQVSLTYSGRAPAGSEVAALDATLVNPYRFDEAEGSLADDMRTKLLFDLAYVASLEHFWTFLRMELLILLKTPWIMLRGVGR
ncbi:MAG TPA: sugar transferase [Polyangiaceae bacterium]|nr:sugar transferase [Polyangiaceae bacterium]